jgi:hypothetical protein
MMLGGGETSDNGQTRYMQQKDTCTIGQYRLVARSPPQQQAVPVNHLEFFKFPTNVLAKDCV